MPSTWTASTCNCPTSDRCHPKASHYRGAYAPAQDEIGLRRHRLPRVAAFARANGLDRLALGNDQAPMGIVTAGKCWHEVRLALRALGLEGDPRIAVWKVGLVWPLEPQGISGFALGKRELLVVEDKTAFRRDPGRGHPLQRAPAPAHHRQDRWQQVAPC